MQLWILFFVWFDDFFLGYMHPYYGLYVALYVLEQHQTKNWGVIHELCNCVIWMFNCFRYYNDFFVIAIFPPHLYFYISFSVFLFLICILFYCNLIVWKMLFFVVFAKVSRDNVNRNNNSRKRTKMIFCSSKNEYYWLMFSGI